MLALTPVMIASRTIEAVGLRIDAIMIASRTLEELSVRIDANHDRLRNYKGGECSH